MPQTSTETYALHVLQKSLHVRHDSLPRGKEDIRHMRSHVKMSVLQSEYFGVFRNVSVEYEVVLRRHVKTPSHFSTT